jgi:hypothetical protein
LNAVDYHHNKSIAVVDDEEDNVTLFTKVIQDNGYQVMDLLILFLSLIILVNIQMNLD